MPEVSARSEVVIHNDKKYFEIYWNEKEALYDALIATPTMEGFYLSLHRNGGKSFELGEIFKDESQRGGSLYCLPDMSDAFGKANEPEQRTVLLAEDLEVGDNLWLYGEFSNDGFHIVSYLVREWLSREYPDLKGRALTQKQIEFEREYSVPVLSFRP